MSKKPADSERQNLNAGRIKKQALSVYDRLGLSVLFSSSGASVIFCRTILSHFGTFAARAMPRVPDSGTLASMPIAT